MTERRLLKSNHPGSLVENCIMEEVALELLAEQGVVSEAVLLQRKTDSPPCVAPWVTGFAQRLNDNVDDESRQRLRLVKDRIKYEARMPTDPVKVKRVAVRFALSAARSVEHLVPDKAKDACARALETVERWLAGEATQQECRTAAYAAYAAAYAAYAAYAASAAYAAYAAAYAAYAAFYAAAYAASAAYAADAADAAFAEEPDPAVRLDRAIDWHVKALAEEGLLALEDEFVVWAEAVS